MNLEAMETSRYLLFAMRPGVIHAHDVMLRAASEYVYSADKEKQLINEIALGKEEDAKKTYDEIIESVMGFSIKAYHSAVLRIAIALNTAVETIERNNGWGAGFDISTFAAEISGFESVGDVNRRFHEMIEQAVRTSGEPKADRYDELIARIVSFIQQDYRDPNLTIHTISENVSMSPVYLGRLFKKKTSKSVSSYLNRRTDGEGEGIASRVGFAD